jgi:hypothetical protein
MVWKAMHSASEEEDPKPDTIALGPFMVSPPSAGLVNADCPSNQLRDSGEPARVPSPSLLSATDAVPLPHTIVQ